ncbi:hypothetical protein E2C01_070934 [Portunus trituberculatus]|uniref:Uncharacterized protein n=1 Tax=Portunus trituberculatus TaxID=210409 RepID=A0A5B7I3J5_PORTR|nr:hypothetical protein [Portunus trituberculatus]
MFSQSYTPHLHQFPAAPPQPSLVLPQPTLRTQSSRILSSLAHPSATQPSPALPCHPLATSPPAAHASSHLSFRLSRGFHRVWRTCCGVGGKDDTSQAVTAERCCRLPLGDVFRNDNIKLHHEEAEASPINGCRPIARCQTAGEGNRSPTAQQPVSAAVVWPHKRMVIECPGTAQLGLPGRSSVLREPSVMNES